MLCIESVLQILWTKTCTEKASCFGGCMLQHAMLQVSMMALAALSHVHLVTRRLQLELEMPELQEQLMTLICDLLLQRLSKQCTSTMPASGTAALQMSLIVLTHCLANCLTAGAETPLFQLVTAAMDCLAQHPCVGLFRRDSFGPELLKKIILLVRAMAMQIGESHFSIIADADQRFMMSMRAMHADACCGICHL